jgi:hypothetical protein
MKKKTKRKYEIEIEVNFVPFPDEERKRESYRKWVRVFLSYRLMSAKR